MDRTRSIAFIVPAYNVEAYIGECLESIVAASTQGDQLILVNDGSQDGTGDICRAWQARHPDLILLVEQPNQGLSAARNNGLRLVSTDYVLFMDSDDAVNPASLLEARRVLQTHQPDVLTMDFCWWHPQKQNLQIRSPHCSHAPRTLLLNNTEFLCETYRDALLSACSRLFKTNLLLQVAPEVFPHGKAYEEIASVPRLIMRAQSLYYLDEPLFRYRVREGSITQSKTLRHCLDLATALTRSNQEVTELSGDQRVHMASNLTTARFLVKSLQDCGLIPQADRTSYSRVLSAGFQTFTLPMTEVIAGLQASNWPGAHKAAKHLSMAYLHPTLYVASRQALQTWKRLRRHWHSH